MTVVPTADADASAVAEAAAPPADSPEAEAGALERVDGKPKQLQRADEVVLPSIVGDLCNIIDRVEKERDAAVADKAVAERRATQAVEESVRAKQEAAELRRENSRLRQRLKAVPKRARDTLERYGMRVV